MTAEIAILNRVGVALAADSAVTISSSRGDQKTYNSADKLFATDGRRPVAIMVHGSAEYMGIPAETIVKRYRASDLIKPQKELSGYIRQFVEFMRTELPIEHKTIVRRLSAAVVDILVHIKADAEDALRSSRLTAAVGSRRARRSCCRSGCWVSCSAACSSPG